MMQHKKNCVSALCAALITVSGATQAQVLEEIVVYSQKRAQSLQDVPIAIAAVSGETLEKRSIDDLSSLSQSLPNVFITENQIDSTISIRGVSTGANKGFEQSVGMYFDGISYGRSQLIRTPMVDLERVEVLRGPQPTLFGKNAIAGAISLYSAKPTDNFEGKLSVSYEFEHDEPQILGVLSGPLTENLNGRLTVSHRELEGWIDNVQLNRLEPQRDETYVRGQLDWDNGGPLTLNLKVESADFDSLGYSMENLNPQDGYQLVFRGPIAVDVVEDYRRASNEVSSTNELQNAVLTAQYQLENHELTSVTGYVEYDTFEVLDVDYTNLDILDGTNQSEKYEQFSQEFRIASPGDERFNYIAGVFYQTGDANVNDDVFLGNFLNLAGPPVSLLVDSQWSRQFEQSSDLFSVFAQFDYELTDALDLTVGARYSKEDKSAARELKILGGATTIADQLPSPNPAIPNLLEFLWAAVLNVGPHSVAGERDENSFDPMVRLQYTLNDNVKLHASVTEASKAGGFDVRSNSIAGTPGIRNAGTFEFEGEEATSLEIGAKMNWDRANVNLTLFQTDYKDLQTNIFDGVLGFLVQNASEASVTGVEADGRFLLTDDLEFYVSAAYNDYEYDRFPQSQCAYREAASSVVNGVAFCDRSGFTAPFAPELTSNLGLNYTRDVANNLVLDFNVNVDTSSEYFLASNLDQNLIENGYTKLGAQVGISGADGKWRLSLIADNLTDERIKVIGGALPLARTFVQLASRGALDGIAYDAIYARPRNITLKFDYNF